jgi:hypothetical protein
MNKLRREADSHFVERVKRTVNDSMDVLKALED